MKKFSRREYLKLVTGSAAGVLLFNPYKPLFESIVKGLIANAEAATTNRVAKNYLVFLQYGGTPRWCWDLFLNPNNKSEEYVANGSVQNFLNTNNGNYSGVNAETSYENASAYNYLKDGIQKQIYMPAIWDSELPVYRNGAAVFEQTAPVLMRDYLRNAMIIRGVNMRVDIGHVRGPELVVRPDPTSSSLTGLVAEANGGPMPSVGIANDASPFLGYNSIEGAPVAYAKWNGNGPLYNLLEPFVIDGSGRTIATTAAANEILMEQAMNEAIAELKSYAISARPGAAALYDTLSGSKSLLAEAAGQFGDLKSDFNTLVAKYNAVSTLSRAAVPGLLAAPAEMANHRNLFSGGFAVAEFLIKKGYTSSFAFNAGNSVRAGEVQTEDGGVKLLQVFNDEHREADRQASFVARHFTYRSFMSCLNLFRESIGESEWANTAVQVGSEYSRTPRNDGSGTDHASNTNVYTLFSGGINHFMPIGNILKTNPVNRGNSGTYGVSAATQVEGTLGAVGITREIGANTIADILGVAKPVRNAISLIRKDAEGNWVSKAEDPKNI